MKVLEKCKKCQFYQSLPANVKIYYYTYPFWELNKRWILILDSPLPHFQKDILNRAFRSLIKDIGIFYLTNCFIASRLGGRVKKSNEIAYCCEKEINFEKFKDNKYLLVCGAQVKRLFDVSASTINFSVYSYGNSKLITLPLLSYFLQDFYNNMRRAIHRLTSSEKEPEVKVSYFNEKTFNILKQSEKICIDIETEGTVNAYLPFKITHIALTSEKLFPVVILLKSDNEIQAFKEILQDSSKTFIGFNVMFDLVHLFRYFSIPMEKILSLKIEDVMFMYYCFNEETKINIGSHSLKSIAVNELGVKEYADPFHQYLKVLKEYEKVQEKWNEKYSHLAVLNRNALKCKERLDNLSAELKSLQTQVDIYNALDAYYTFLLYKSFYPEIKVNYWSLYSFLKTIAKHLSLIIDNGMYIDSDQISELKKQYKLTQIDAERFIKNYLNLSEINLNSEHQLSSALKPILPKAKQTTTGLISTSESAIQEYQNLYPQHSVLWEQLLKWKYCEKMLNTYIKTFETEKDSQNLFHGGFSVIGTETGRISSKGLLQQLPRTEIRKIFSSRFGKDGIFLSADYKQAELRVAAMLSGDKTLIQHLLSGDPYKEFIAKVLKKSVNEVTSEERSTGKHTILGTLYGITEYGLSRILKQPVEQCKKYLDEFYSLYSEFAQWKQSIIQKIYSDCQIKYTFRTRRFPQFFTPALISKRLKFRLYNSAVNAPIQGTTSDITLLNFLRVHYAMLRKGLKSKIVNIVHDSFLIDVYKPELDTVIEILLKYGRYVPQKWVKVKIPVELEIKIGSNYYDLKEIEIDNVNKS